MKVRFLRDDTLGRLSPASVKVLLFLSSVADRRRVARGTVVEATRRIQFSRARWRSAVEELAGEGLVSYRVSTQGFEARLGPADRFSWLPDWDDDRVLRLSPTACKALLALCRAFSNRSGTVRMRLATLALRLGRSRRMAQIAVRELVDRCLISTYRTGRSSWFVLRRPDDARFPFAPPVAHRCGVLMRLLSVSTPSDLSRVLAHASRRGLAVDPLRDTLSAHATLQRDGHRLRKRLERLGFDRDEALITVLRHTAREVMTALELVTGRAIHDAVAYVRKALRKGWCST